MALLSAARELMMLNRLLIMSNIQRPLLIIEVNLRMLVH